MDQQIFNIAVGIAAFLGGWWMKTMWETLRDLQTADKELTAKVGNIEVLIAGDYVRRDQLEKLTEAIFNKLNRIEDKLDGKEDKCPK